MALLDAPAVRRPRPRGVAALGPRRRRVQRGDRAGPARRGRARGSAASGTTRWARSSPGRSAPRGSGCSHRRDPDAPDRADAQGTPRRPAVAGPLLPQRQRGVPAVARPTSTSRPPTAAIADGRRAAPDRHHGRARPGTARRGRAGRRGRPGRRHPRVLRRQPPRHAVVRRRGGTGAGPARRRRGPGLRRAGGGRPRARPGSARPVR